MSRIVDTTSSFGLEPCTAHVIAWCGMKCFTFSCKSGGLGLWSKRVNKMIYSIVLVSPLARNILDDLETLVAQLQGHLVEQSYNLVILVMF